jgi:hypothetical protein
MDIVIYFDKSEVVKAVTPLLKSKLFDSVSSKKFFSGKKAIIFIL